MHSIDTKKYILAFFITLLVFGAAVTVSNYFNDKRLAEVRSIEDSITIDILSSETQFDLLRESSCKALDGSILSQELNELATKLSYMENDRGPTDPELSYLKRYYSLLEIKDYTLLNQLTEKCGGKPMTILYFYSNTQNCDDCKRVSYVLSYLRDQYPDLRVYSFDYDLDLSAIQTIISLNNLQNQFPALVIGDEVYYGFKSVEEIEDLMPALKASIATTTSATSTSATTTKKR